MKENEMPNRDHETSDFDRAPQRWSSRDERDYSGQQGLASSSPASRYSPTRRTSGYSQADFDRAQGAYSAEWRSYAQDWRDTPQPLAQSGAWPRAEGYARQRTDQGHRHESVYDEQESSRPDWARASHPSLGHPRARFDSSQHGEETLGQQLRHAGHQVVNRVKRVFRGPKGYKRTDERILEDVNERLAHQDQLDPSEIEVRVENGEVTLTGSVESRWDKFAAEEIADDVRGVDEVHNQLRVRRVADARGGTGLLSGASGQAESPLRNSNIRA
jgi:hypothetical protein